MTSIKSETEFSPYVQEYWGDKGYCVHGEVAVFKTSLFIDHIAHTGPCHDPDHVIGIELKKSAGKSLRKQLKKLDRKHVVDEIWGAVISTPREKTLREWDDLGRWLRPGLLYWEDGNLVEYQPCVEIKPYTRKIKKDRLLLISENRNIIAGYPSGHEDNVYQTHWKVIKSSTRREVLQSEDRFQASDLMPSAPHFIQLYKNPEAALGRVLRQLEEEDRIIRQIGKENKKPVYEKLTAEEDDLIDDRFLDMFEIL